MAAGVGQGWGSRAAKKRKQKTPKIRGVYITGREKIGEKRVG